MPGQDADASSGRLSLKLKRYARKTGLPPGTPVYVGQDRDHPVSVTVTDYGDDFFREHALDFCEPGLCRVPEVAHVTRWVHVDGIYESDRIQAVCELFGVHPLVVEDILNTGQRPKIEFFEQDLFVVLKEMHFEEESGEIVEDQVCFILGPNYLLSFEEKSGEAVRSIRERLRVGRGLLRKLGPDYLLYGLLDAIVDRYFLALEGLGDRIEEIHEAITESPPPDALEIIHGLKRNILYLRKSVWPLREVVGLLEKSDLPLLNRRNRIYFRDLYDHAYQVVDTVETFRDVVSGMVDIHLSMMSMRMNQVMKVLTIIATIFIPLTFLAGVYGMNFKRMPELEWTYGYPALWIVMIAIALAMLYAFKKNDWL